MKYWVEYFTNRVTMEKLVLYCLFAIFLFALGLSSIGELPFSPLAVLLSFIVLVFVSYGVNLALGALYGVSVSYGSPVITALILGFIFTPTLEPLGLSLLGLIAIIAMASKFVLAYRGRHIFNPAAIAAVLIGFTGLLYASWWVATPLLLPVVAIGAFLTLYKTRHLTMGLLFLLVATTLIVVQGVIAGDTVGYMLSLALLSWPIVFFAGFMLTEPLTLPPRRWQKLALAVLVAILMAVPFQIGEVSSSPHLALVLINILAFAFGQRRGMSLTLDSVQQLTPTVKEFVFRPKYPLRFQPGQYIELQLSQPKPDSRGTRRSFSIVGLPGEETFRLAVKFPEKTSSFKQSLASLSPGSKVSATRVSGDFVLPGDSSAPLLFVAGGVGITPFVSLMREVVEKQLKTSVTLLYAVAHPDELAYIDIFISAGARVIVVTPHTSYTHSGTDHIAAEYVTKDVLESIEIAPARSAVYVSGPPMMVDATSELLKKSGAKNVRRDYFSGY